MEPAQLCLDEFSKSQTKKDLRFSNSNQSEVNTASTGAESYFRFSSQFAKSGTVSGLGSSGLFSSSIFDLGIKDRNSSMTDDQ